VGARERRAANGEYDGEAAEAASSLVVYRLRLPSLVVYRLRLLSLVVYRLRLLSLSVVETCRSTSVSGAPLELSLSSLLS
jgi:hypothetical protein